MNTKDRSSVDNNTGDLLIKYRQTHDQRYLNALFYPFMELIYGLCLKYFKNTADAEDAVMDIYLTISHKLKEHEVSHFKSWLYVVSKNHCLDVLRSRGAKLLKENEVMLMYSEEVFHLNEENYNEEQLKALEHCLEQIPTDQKDVLTWFYFEKMSYHEIVQKSGKHWNKVRSEIQNGRRNLKNCMEEK